MYPSLKVANVALSCMLMLFVGSFYATSLFSNAIQQIIPPYSALSGKWATSMGTLSLLSAPAMMIAALFLESADDSSDPQIYADSKSTRVKVLTAIGGFFFFSFGLAAYGVRLLNAPLVVIGVTLLGIPLGIFYMLSTSLNSVWMYRHPGLGVGLSQGAFGMGTIVFSSIFEALINMLGTSTAISFSGFLLAVPALFAALVMRWPVLPTEPEPEEEELFETEELCHNVPLDMGEKIAFTRLSQQSTFWVYMGIVFCSQTGFALVPWFYDMGTAFGLPLERVVILFQVANAVGTAWRLLGGIVSDALSLRNTRMGSKILLTVLLGVQTVSFLSLAIVSIWTIRWGFVVFIITSVLLFVCFAGGACACAILARDLFGCNAPTVYGTSAGFATGIGEAAASAIVARTLSQVDGPSKYIAPYVMLTAASLVGLLCSVIVKKNRLVFPPHKVNDRSVINYGSADQTVLVERDVV